MLNGNDAMSFVEYCLEGVNQLLDIVKMKSGSGFIKDEKRMLSVRAFG